MNVKKTKTHLIFSRLASKLFFLLVFFSETDAQTTLTLLSNLSYNGVNTSSNNELADIWGYANATNEFAIVGLENGTSIVDVTNSLNPVEIYWSPGVQTFWRDIKTYKNYAYITNEGGNGLEIIDLSNLPVSATATNYRGGVLAGTSTNVSFTKAHNIYIDENGIAYIFGANYGVGGAIMLDLRVNPTNPPVVGLYNVRYCHDGYVRNNTLYSSEINDGIFSIVDVSDKQNPVVLGTAATESSFTHNAWLSDDGNYLFTTDEVSDSEIGAYNVADPTDIKRVDGIKSVAGGNSIVHNTHVLNNFLFSSYYRDGVTVVDANCPDILVEVANYDTSPQFAGNGFNGCWGVYPFLPSGNIIASDIENGLYVMGNNYKRASYLIGNVTNENGNALNNVQITVTNFPQGSTTTDLVGDYKTGIAAAGIYTVIFSAQGYDSIEFDIDFQAGIKTVQNVQFGVNLTCPAVLNVVGNIDAGTYQADDIIISNGKVNSQSNGSVIFNAGFNTNEYIELQANFEADGSFDFFVENKQCDLTD